MIRENIIEILEDQDIDVGKYLELSMDSSCGGVSMFMGTTRDEYEGKEVVQLSYEAYIPLAMKSLREIVADVREKYAALGRVVVVHRIGVVAVMESSVLVICSAVHRYEAIRGVEEIINRLKKETAIWKKEIYSDGSCVWKGECIGCTT